MSTLVLLAGTGLGLAGLYFLVASGLTIVFGLADVLNFAHGVFISAGGYAAWWLAGRIGGTGGLLAGLAAGVLCGAAVGTAVELALIRPIYRRAIQQVLITVGLSIAGVALLDAAWGADPRPFPRPAWALRVTTVLGAHVPNTSLVLVAGGLVVLGLLEVVLRRTRFGLIIRAGVENRAMVAALGVDVRAAFTLVFAVGGALAGFAGALAGLYFGTVSPGQGTSLLIFAIIVVVIGGAGSVTGSAYAAVAVGLSQQFVNYYAASLGDICVVALLAAVLLVRRGGFALGGAA